MNLIYNHTFLEHDTGMHPENKKRLQAFDNLEDSILPDGEQYLHLIHTPEYIQKVKLLCKTENHLDADTVICPQSYDIACQAVGATILAAEQGDFALVRPPGHHAYPSHASGFCIFNNIAIAAKYLCSQDKRVLIFDFDGHLGDGTERIFYEDDQVLYWSFHQYPAFPQWGSEEEIGIGRGEGYTINVPLPPNSGDDLFLREFHSLLKIAHQFSPDVVAVSAGFDAHHSDLLLDLRLSADTFYQIGRTLRENFSNIFATLEGGYNVEMLPNCVYNFLNGINGKDIYFSEQSTESSIQVIDEFELRLGDLESRLANFWSL